MRCLLILLCLSGVFARTLRVPQDYPTIQSALDIVANDDTVLVALGTYAEALVAPLGRFVLKGDVVPDTGLYPRPVVDPSTLPNPTTLTCLLLGGGQVVMEDMAFRNGPEMYPRYRGVGGVEDRCYPLIARRCIFDSTRYGIWCLERPVVLEECHFIHNEYACVAATRGEITATDCDFSGNSDRVLITCGRGSSFTRCHVHDNPGLGHLMEMTIHDFVMRDCVIGPTGPNVSYPIFGGGGNALFEGNVFRDSQHFGAFMVLSCDCDTPNVIRNNVFLRLGPREGGDGGCGISATCEDTCPCVATIIEDNVFFEGRSVGWPKAMILANSAVVSRNRFVKMRPESETLINVFSVGVVCRDNLFVDNGMAIDLEPGHFIDARWNWWGDSTGPYHPILNPMGRGDSVGEGVLFEPWHRDTLFLLSSPEPNHPLPHEVSIRVYPNPFNVQTRLRLEVGEPQILRVELYDLLGRRVREVWSGAVAFEKELIVNGSDLSSGVYFVRATNTIFNRPVATAKLALVK